jgi:SEC-C motif
MQPATQYSPDATLTPVQHHVLSLLAQGSSVTEAAAAAEIHRNTITNWRRTVPAFARELEFAGRERSLFWHDQAANLAQKAIEVMTAILNDETAAPSLRLRVALKVVGMASAPRPESIRPFPAFAAQLEAVDGRLLLLKAQCAEAEREETIETVHNSAQSPIPTPIRRPAEPGRNSPCPCGSGIKYKRCCADGGPALIAAAAPPPTVKLKSAG